MQHSGSGLALRQRGRATAHSALRKPMLHASRGQAGSSRRFGWLRNAEDIAALTGCRKTPRVRHYRFDLFDFATKPKAFFSTLLSPARTVGLGAEPLEHGEQSVRALCHLCEFELR